MRKLFAIVLVAILMVPLGAFGVSATETTAPTEPDEVSRAPGYCGETITWALDNGTLTITGTGKMDDFPEGAPWSEHKDEITRVVISGGITYVGAYAFKDFDALTDVEFGSDIYEIGTEAFWSCDGLTKISLPAAFRVFGESSFLACSNLKEIHCQGKFPSFRQNCLWDTYAIIYYPAGRPWNVDTIIQLEQAFHGRIEFLASDGTDPYQPVEETQTPETTEPETVPPTTQEPTQPATEPTQAPTEETVTVPESSAPATQAATEEADIPEPEEPDGDKKDVSWILIVIIGVCGTAMILGIWIFLLCNRRGKYSKKRRRR